MSITGMSMDVKHARRTSVQVCWLNLNLLGTTALGLRVALSVQCLASPHQSRSLQSSGILLEEEKTVTSTFLRLGSWTPVDVKVKPQQLGEIPSPHCFPHPLASGVEVSDCHNPHHLGLRFHVL
jgi:hypothetical protein